MAPTQRPAASRGPIPSVDAALAVVGDRWSILIMREVFHGSSRFDDFLRTTGISRAVLSSRLRSLTGAGLLRRVPYQEGRSRARSEYLPTRTGLALLPAFVALMDWAERAADAAGPADLLTHRACGARVHAVLTCDRGHRVEPRDIESRRADPAP